jgi:toxin YoeB
MRLVFTPRAWSDYLWFQSHEKRLLKRLNQLIQDVLRSPFEGIGKPEPLKGELSGFWSRRIDEQHRLVYSASDREVVVIACRYHYGN